MAQAQNSIEIDALLLEEMVGLTVIVEKMQPENYSLIGQYRSEVAYSVISAVAPRFAAPIKEHLSMFRPQPNASRHLYTMPGPKSVTEAIIAFDKLTITTEDGTSMSLRFRPGEERKTAAKDAKSNTDHFGFVRLPSNDWTTSDDARTATTAAFEKIGCKVTRWAAMGDAGKFGFDTGEFAVNYDIPANFNVADLRKVRYIELPTNNQATFRPSKTFAKAYNICDFCLYPGPFGEGDCHCDITHGRPSGGGGGAKEAKVREFWAKCDKWEDWIFVQWEMVTAYIPPLEWMEFAIEWEDMVEEQQLTHKRRLELRAQHALVHTWTQGGKRTRQWHTFHESEGVAAWHRQEAALKRERHERRQRRA